MSNVLLESLVFLSLSRNYGVKDSFFAKIKKKTPSRFYPARGVEDQGASTNKVF
jgi:hypothetical protein